MTYNTRFVFQTKKEYNGTGAFDIKTHLQASETHATKSVLVFHFINRLFALSGSSISLYLSGTSMVVVVFSYNKVLLNVKRLFFLIYTVTIRSFLIFTPVYQLDTLRSIAFIVSFVV